MKESTFRRRVVQLLHPYGAFAVENPAWPGTPDVSTTVGWIELKVLRSWPTRTLDGIVRVPHLTQIQRIWHQKWTAAGGVSWLLIMIGKDILLIHGALLPRVGHSTRSELECMAWAKWNSLAQMDVELSMALRPGVYGRRST
ncbi:MAG: hypothetical protein ACXWWG_00560 [Nitrospira sp.]